MAVVAALVVTCTVGVAPASASHGKNGKVCIVEDVGGDENPLNAAAASEIKAARSKLHVDVVSPDAATPADIQANLDSFVSSGDCDLIIGLGFLVGPVMEPFIIANPDQDFVAVDLFYGGIYPNVAEIVFLSDEAGFLAGYVAAGISETGKVGVFGGLPVPGVTLFMDGYALGVERYNAEYDAGVEVLGWDPDLQSGLFAFTFEDPVVGQMLAADLYDQGADTVFPVAGFTSFGALAEAAERADAGQSVRVVGVDFDWSGFLGDPDRVILTSAVKDYGPAAFKQIEALVDGTWAAGFVVEGLESGAVDIAPFHRLNRAVPGYLKRDLKAIRAGIIDGTIATTP